jgi:hypothetical protein
MTLNLDVRVRSLDARDGTPFASVVENISGGGVLLRADRKFAHGSRLEITFPALEDAGEGIPPYVLVEVVLSRLAGDSAFVSHCRFVAVSRTTLLKLIVEPPRRRRPRSRSNSDLTSAAS